MLTIFERYVFLGDFFLVLFFMDDCLPECMFMYQVCAVPAKARKGCQILYNWSSRWFCDPPHGYWEPNLGPSEEGQRSLPQSHLFIYSTLSFEARSLPLGGG